VGLELVQLAATSAVPKFLAKKMILKKMQTAIAELLDRHCGRVRYDPVNCLTRTVKELMAAALLHALAITEGACRAERATGLPCSFKPPSGLPRRSI